MSTVVSHRAGAVVAGLLAIGLCVGLAQPAGAQRPSPGAVPSASPAPSQPAAHAAAHAAATNQGAGAWSWLAFVYVILLFALVAGIHLTDSVQLWIARRRQGPVKSQEEDKLLTEGIPGTTRSIFAYALLLILGIAIFHLLAVINDDDARQGAYKLLDVLAGTVGTVIGFYFGSKATKEGRAEEPRRPPGAAGRIDYVDPKKAAPGERVKIFGAGFGKTAGELKFGDTRATEIKQWEADRIEVSLPREENGKPIARGPIVIKVNPTTGQQIESDAQVFEVMEPKGGGAP